MSDSSSTLLARLSPSSFRISTTTDSVRVDDEIELTQLIRLRIHGSSDAYRWLAKLLTELADNADSRSFDQVIVSHADLSALELDDWDAMHLECDGKRENAG